MRADATSVQLGAGRHAVVLDAEGIHGRRRSVPWADVVNAFLLTPPTPLPTARGLAGLRSLLGRDPSLRGSGQRGSLTVMSRVIGVHAFPFVDRGLSVDDSALPAALETAIGPDRVRLITLQGHWQR